MSDKVVSDTKQRIGWVRNKFLTGLFILIPLIATYWVLKFLYRVVSGFTEPLVRQFVAIFGDSLPWLPTIQDKTSGELTIPGLALVTTLLAIMAVGLLATNVFGRRIMHWVDGVMIRIPLVNLIYPVAKQVVDSLKEIGGNAEATSGKNKPVVFLKYPGFNGYLIGFQTGRFLDQKGKSMVSVFIPTAPNPITGFVLVFEEKDVVQTNMPYDDAWKMIVSAGLVVPRHLALSGFPLQAKAAMPGPGPADTTQKG